PNFEGLGGTVLFSDGEGAVRLVNSLDFGFDRHRPLAHRLTLLGLLHLHRLLAAGDGRESEDRKSREDRLHHVISSLLPLNLAAFSGAIDGGWSVVRRCQRDFDPAVRASVLRRVIRSERPEL